jgi:hypothetical protein
VVILSVDDLIETGKMPKCVRQQTPFEVARATMLTLITRHFTAYTGLGDDASKYAKKLIEAWKVVLLNVLKCPLNANSYYHRTPPDQLMGGIALDTPHGRFVYVNREGDAWLMEDAPWAPQPWQVMTERLFGQVQPLNFLKVVMMGLQMIGTLRCTKVKGIPAIIFSAADRQPWFYALIPKIHHRLMQSEVDEIPIF